MSMQYWKLGGVTRIGTVSSCAHSAGTPTSLMLRLGSGLMTVRAEKLTRLPDRFERKRPSLPFRRCEIVLRGRPERWRAGGMPAVWLSKYVVMWYWRSSHRSSTMSCGAPASRFSCRRWLMRMTSTSLCVRSSSERSPDSSVMLGRMVTGGTGRTVRTIHSGRHTAGLRPSRLRSSLGTFSSHSRTSDGVILWPVSRGGVGAGQVGVLVGDLREPLAHLGRRHLVAVLAEGGGLVDVDGAVLAAAVRADGDVGGLLGDALGQELGVLLLLDVGLEGLVEVLADALREQQLAAAAARRAQDVAHDTHEADVDDRHRQVDVAEVAGAVADLLAARLAAQAGLDDAQAGVHQAHLDGEAVVVVGVGRDDLGRGQAADLLGRQQAELHVADLLRLVGEHLADHGYTRASRRIRGAMMRDLSSSISSLNA